MIDKSQVKYMRTNLWLGGGMKSAIILLAVLVVCPLGAQSHYINANAIGGDDGSNWADAWTDIPSSLVRGHTYYIADGNYSSYSFDTAESGDLYITIVKATPSNHGTDVGWNDDLGKGHAIFEPGLHIDTGYWILDGSTGFGDQDSSYGFIVEQQACGGITRSELISLGTSTVSHVRLSHFALLNCGSSYDIPQYNIYSNSYKSPSTDIIISHNYLVNGSSNMLIRGWHNCIIEYNYFGYNWSSSNNHGQNISPGSDCDDIILRGNIFRNSSIFVVGTHKNDNHRWKVYNNIVIGGSLSAAFANADSSSSDVVLSWEVHHNTFINVDFGGRGAVFVGTLSDPSKDKSFARNNLFFECTNPQYDVPNVEYSQSVFYRCDGVFDKYEGGTAQVDSVNPFVNVGAENYELSIATYPGIPLTVPFDVDNRGETRGLDGVWDRGAYEFQDPQGVVANPTGLRIKE